MTITSSGNVLIVGAGASADFGLPLGGPLLSEVRDELRFQVKEMENAKFRIHDGDDIDWSYFTQRKRTATGYDTRDYPIWLWLQNTIKKEEDELHIHSGDGRYFKRLASMMISVADLLDEQTSETIDDFIAMNPKTSPMVKLAIACVFYRIIFESEDRNHAVRKRVHVREFETQSGNPKKSKFRRNWVHLLINIVRHAAYNKTLTDDQKIKIISFNYDGILESILDSQFDNTGHEFKPWRDYIEIIHPHGWMGELPETCSNMKNTVENWASAINVVNEKNPSGEVKKARNTATKWIREADKIFMAGFALSAPNAKMLGLGSNYRKDAQHWYIHNYDGSPGLKYSARSYEREFQILEETRPFGSSIVSLGSIDVSFEGGTNDVPMTIANWFQIGIPGEMPG